MPETVVCPSCKRKVPWTEEAWDHANQRCHGSTGSGESVPTPQTFEDVSGRSVFLTLLGLACIAVGLYYLVLHPSNPNEYGADSGTVTIHRLVIGQTATLAGVIFCAAA